MAFRSTCRRLQRLSGDQLREAQEYAQAIEQQNFLTRVISVHRPSRQRISTLYHLLSRVSYKPTVALGSGTHFAYYVDARNIGAHAVMKNGSPRRVSLALVPAGLSTLPEAFSKRVWAGGKLTYGLGPRNWANECCNLQLRVSQMVKSMRVKALDSDRPSISMNRVFAYGSNAPHSLPRLVEERMHVFMTPDHPRETRTFESLPVPSFTRDVMPDPPTLFWYSMVTQNPHRIHYDADYARSEGFTDCVVHGPYTVSLLLQMLNKHKPGGLQVHSFEYRATNPLYVNRFIRLCVQFRPVRQSEPTKVQDPIWIGGRARAEGDAAATPDSQPPAPRQYDTTKSNHITPSLRDRNHAWRERKWHDAFHDMRSAQPDLDFHSEYSDYFAEQLSEEEAARDGAPADIPANTRGTYDVATMAELWAVDANGVVGMRATATLVHAPRQKLDGFGLRKKLKNADARVLKDHVEMNKATDRFPIAKW